MAAKPTPTLPPIISETARTGFNNSTRCLSRSVPCRRDVFFSTMMRGRSESHLSKFIFFIISYGNASHRQTQPVAVRSRPTRQKMFHCAEAWSDCYLTRRGVPPASTREMVSTSRARSLATANSAASKRSEAPVLPPPTFEGLLHAAALRGSAEGFEEVGGLLARKFPTYGQTRARHPKPNAQGNTCKYHRVPRCVVGWLTFLLTHKYRKTRKR